MHCGRFRGGCNDNANVFGLKVQREGALGQSGWRVVCGHRRSQLNRQEIWGENWGDEGWPLPVIKKKKSKRSGQSLYLMELMLPSMGSSIEPDRLLLCRSPLASIRSVRAAAQGDLRQTLNRPQ